MYFAPGAIAPELNVPPVAVCVTVSLFVHVTLPPAAMVTGLGEYAVVVIEDAPATIATGVPLFPPLDGVVGDVGDVVDE